MHTYVPFSSKGDLFYIEFILMQMENAGYHLWVLVFIMVACGAFGGFLNYLNDFDTIENEKKNKQIRFKYILLGIGAALLIPLFLNMISSDMQKLKFEQILVTEDKWELGQVPRP